MAIAFDSTSNGSNSNASASLTFSHTCTGTNLILFVGVWQNNNTNRITGVTYNGVAMTAIDSLDNSDNNNWLALYYILNPATGANNVVVTCNTNPTNIHAISASYTGVKQSGQPDNHGTKSTSVGAGGAQTNSLTSVADNCWMVSFVGGAGDPPNASTNFTRRDSSTTNERFGDSNGVIHPAGSFSQSVTNSGASSESITMLSATFAPVAATSTLHSLASLGAGS